MFNKGVGLDRGVGGGGKFYEWTGKRMREGKSSKLSSKKGASVSKFTLIKLFFNWRRFIYFASMSKIQIFLYLYPQIPPKYVCCFLVGAGVNHNITICPKTSNPASMPLMNVINVWTY
jgi:hypothetical protein